MVRLLLFSLISMAAGCAEYGLSTNKPTELQAFLKPEFIQIAHNGAYSGDISSDETAETCKTFTLDKSDIVTFFQLAHTVSLDEYSHDLIASNCFASGSLVSGGHKIGDWKIDRARRGFFHPTDNKTQLYYCNACQSTIFYEP